MREIEGEEKEEELERGGRTLEARGMGQLNPRLAASGGGTPPDPGTLWDPPDVDVSNPRPHSK